MKASGATSGPATGTQPHNAADRSANPPSLGADGGYPLAGPSDLPDPATNAFRHDLADVALAGRVIASHYAEPLPRHVTATADLFSQSKGAGDTLATLNPGDEFRMLDCTGGWAWGYGPDGRVGYVIGTAIGV